MSSIKENRVEHRDSHQTSPTRTIFFLFMSSIPRRRRGIDDKDRVTIVQAILKYQSRHWSTSSRGRTYGTISSISEDLGFSYGVVRRIHDQLIKQQQDGRTFIEVKGLRGQCGRKGKDPHAILRAMKSVALGDRRTLEDLADALKKLGHTISSSTLSRYKNNKMITKGKLGYKVREPWLVYLVYL